MKHRSIHFIAPILFATLYLCCVQVYGQRQTPKTDFGSTMRKAVGTGQTTGHIATLLVQNTGTEAIVTAAQTVYIRSDGNYQSYVARIPPGIVIPPGTTQPVPVDGVCTDPSKPAVPEGVDMPPLKDWIPVISQTIPDAITDPEGVVTHIIERPALPTFTPEDFPSIINTRGFKPWKESEIPVIVTTWPGTEIPVRGIIDPVKYPETFAPMIVRIVEEIEKATTIIQEDPIRVTPYSDKPRIENKVIVQHATWMCMGALIGDPYERDDFTEHVYTQYAGLAGIASGVPSEEEKEKLEPGIEDFWNVFMATGVEAKVISQPESDKPQVSEPTISIPTLNCKCTVCSVVRNMRIVDQNTGREITQDTIPTFLDQLQCYAPEIRSDCPEECKPQYATEIQIVPHYNCIRDAASDWVSDSMHTRVKGPGYVDIESRYRCTCYGAPCGQGADKRRLYLTESNNCCDRIRCQNNGQLKFNFRNGNVVIVGNQLVLNMNTGQREVIDFDFNLEATFCNLSDNQIFAQLQSLASQHTAGSNVNEFMHAQDISLDHPTDIQDTRPWYSLIFSRTVNGQEFSVSIAMDEQTCAFDLQVLYGEEIYEHAAPPFISPNTLRDMGITLGDHRTRRFWHRALIVMGQLLRAKEYRVESDYHSAYLNFLSRLKIGVESLQNDPDYTAMHADLANLHTLLVQGMTTGDFALIDEILNALLTVYNQMQG